MRANLFKPPERLDAIGPYKLTRIGVMLVLTGLAAQPACNFQPRARLVTVQSLETARETRPTNVHRGVISNWTALQNMYSPLGDRLGLFQARNAEDWERLRAAAPEIGPAPDFTQGAVVALASHAGMPVNGVWPIHLDSIRIHNGAGFACGSFTGGTYLPNDAAFVEMAQFKGLASVVMVEIDGMRFYPE